MFSNLVNDSYFFFGFDVTDTVLRLANMHDLDELYFLFIDRDMQLHADCLMYLYLER